MAEKTELTREEIYQIGLKIVENRENQRAQGRERRRVKNALYKLYTDGKFGDLKV